MIIQPKVARWAVPLIGPRRYKGCKGGRSGGKSHQWVELAVARMAANPDYAVVCIREVQKSIRFSIKKLVEQKIRKMGVSHLFEIQEQVIKRIGGAGVCIFVGMQDHTADSIKGLEDFDLALIDEAQNLSARSLELLRPTLRKQDAELWFAWNPENEDDPVDVMFRENEGDPRFICVTVNITDNPFVSQDALSEYYAAKALAEKQSETDPNATARFLHIWHGHYNTRSDRLILRNWRTAELQPPERAVWFYGVDFGFSRDATAALRCCVMGRILYVDHEAWEVGVSTDALPSLLHRVPDIHKWPSAADSARPETIDYLRRYGFPKMRPARKGPGSVEDGITFMQAMDMVIHPRCANLIRECSTYSYKIDKHTGEIMREPEDANNHLIDALRYATERLHRKAQETPAAIKEPDDMSRDYHFTQEEEADGWKTV